MTFREFREQVLGLAASQGDAALEAHVSSFFSKLARFDDRDFEEVIKMFALLRAPKAPTANKAAEAESAEASLLRDLRRAFSNDVEFREVVQAMKVNKAIGREALNRIYCALFDKTRPLASKATRDKLIQDIADLRLERVRSKRAAEYFAGKAAE